MAFLKDFATRLGMQVLKMTNRVFIADTTLRDGEQTAGAAMKLDDKLTLALAIEAAGADSIEAGFPVASMTDFKAARAIAGQLTRASVTVLARCEKADIDVAARAIKDAKTRRSITLFIGSSEPHLKLRYKKSQQEIIDIAVAHIKYAKDKCDVVSFGAEDMTRAKPEFIWQLYEAAIDAGANVVALTDTIGILTPKETAEWARGMKKNIPNISKVFVGSHFHNDLGLGLANALAAIENGVNIVQTTVNGLGERGGNVALEELALTLHLKKDVYGKTHGVDLSKLYALSRLVAEKSGMPVNPHKPVVGEQMFVTAAGLHHDCIEVDPDIYQLFRPELIGAPPLYCALSRHASRAGLRWRLKRLGWRGGDEELGKLYVKFQSIASQKKLVSDEDLAKLAGL